MINEGHATFDYRHEKGHAPVRCWIDHDGWFGQRMPDDMVDPRDFRTVLVHESKVIDLMTSGRSRLWDSVGAVIIDGTFYYTSADDPDFWYTSEGVSMVASEDDPEGLPEGTYYEMPEGMSFIWSTDADYDDVFGNHWDE